jgi:electron transport complex protein RnfA
MEDYLLILIGAVFVNNIVLSQFLGICPFLGVSGKVSTSVGMSGAVLFVMTIATTVTYLLHQYVLVPMGLDYLRTITFILVIAALVQMVEIVLKKVSPPLYQALGVFLPLITTNCAVLGVAILALGLEDGNLLKAVFFAVSSSAGFALALIVFASIREFLELADIPEGMKGVPINLLVAGLLSLAFLGFAGLV